MGEKGERSERKQQSNREQRAHHPLAHDLKWEAQPGALNPLSAGTLIQSEYAPCLTRH